MRVPPSIGAAPELDVGLVNGFSFTCRDDCGLCCFTTPRVRASERAPLLRIVPELELLENDGGTFVASRPNGGACELLAGHRCRAHAARPTPCREFPVATHIGQRIQATLVLSCPGLDLEPLRDWRPPGPGPGSGLEGELASVRARIDATTRRRVDEATRRRARLARALEREGRWVDEGAVRAKLRSEVPLPGPDDFPVEDPPSTGDGLELLPLFFDGRAGPVAIASDERGWALLELRPEGGIDRTVAIVPPPSTVPELTDAADRVLRGYLQYWLARDALFGAVHLEMLASDRGDVTEWVEDELRRIGALTLARADLRVRARTGVARRLADGDVLDGIRAVDQDLLDRRTWGSPL
jgi:Fe-S-cluster containining protein